MGFTKDGLNPPDWAGFVLGGTSCCGKFCGPFAFSWSRAKRKVPRLAFGFASLSSG